MFLISSYSLANPDFSSFDFDRSAYGDASRNKNRDYKVSHIRDYKVSCFRNSNTLVYVIHFNKSGRTLRDTYRGKPGLKNNNSHLLLKVMKQEYCSDIGKK
jgi:hypothetical protein